MEIKKLFSFSKNSETKKEVSASEIELKKAYRISVTAGILTLFIFFLLTYVVHIVNQWFAPFTGLFPLVKGDTLKYVLLGTSVAVSLLIRLIRSLLPSGRISIHLPSSMNIFSETVQGLLFTSIITFGLCMIVVFFGLAVFLVSGHPLDFYIFLVLSLVLLATNFSGYRDWVEQFNNFSKTGNKALNKNDKK